jgi:hypothetical protein
MGLVEWIGVEFGGLSSMLIMPFREGFSGVKGVLRVVMGRDCNKYILSL